MDAGCYAVSAVRFLAGAEPEAVRAEARLSSPGVDRWLRAELRFPDGRSGRVTASLFSTALLRMEARVRGERGELHVLNPFAPQFFHRLKLRTPAGSRVERLRFGKVYGGWWGAVVVRDGGAAVRRSAERYVARLRGERP